MTIGRFAFKLNNFVITEYINSNSVSVPVRNFPWLTFALRTPLIMLPFYRKNEFGEWECIVSISAPTLLQCSKCDDVSWEFHGVMLGFGISFIYQFGY